MTPEQLQAMNQTQEAAIKAQWLTISRLQKAVSYWRGQARGEEITAERVFDGKLG